MPTLVFSFDNGPADYSEVVCTTTTPRPGDRISGRMLKQRHDDELFQVNRVVYVEDPKVEIDLSLVTFAEKRDWIQRH